MQNVGPSGVFCGQSDCCEHTLKWLLPHIGVLAQRGSAGGGVFTVAMTGHPPKCTLASGGAGVRKSSPSSMQQGPVVQSSGVSQAKGE